MNFLYLLFQADQITDGMQTFLGIDIIVWQIVLIPLVYGIIELLKYLYRTYKSSKVESEKNKLESESEYNIQHAVDGFVKKTMEADNEKLKHGLLLQQNKETLSVLNNHLKIIRKKIDSDRVWLGKFHNGVDNATYPANIDQLFTIIGESRAYGISSQMKFFKNIPVAFYSVVLDSLLKSKHVVITDISKIDKTMYLVLELQGIKAMGAVGVFNNRNELKGVLGIDFIREQREISKEDIEYLTDKTQFLIDYLDKYQLYAK